jgi:glycosyltransferase involved in cell wall biosynthesis
VADTGGVHPRFSVVIPVRDRADVVGRAVASVLAQTFAALEVVVVDDASTDHSVAAVRAVSDGRVRIVDGPAAGVEVARWSGVAAARGPWIAFVDPDDEVAPGWLARLGRLADATGAVLVSCGGEQVHADGSTTLVGPSARPGGFAVQRDVLLGFADWLPEATTPEPLVRWNDPVPSDVRDAEQLQLRWALQSLDALARTPIPDPELMVRSATVGAIAAVRLGDHRRARRLFRLARGVAPERPRVWARWALSCVPPVAERIWADDEPVGWPFVRHAAVQGGTP